MCVSMVFRHANAFSVPSAKWSAVISALCTAFAVMTSQLQHHQHQHQHHADTSSATAQLSNVLARLKSQSQQTEGHGDGIAAAAGGVGQSRLQSQWREIVRAFSTAERSKSTVKMMRMQSLRMRIHLTTTMTKMMMTMKQHSDDPDNHQHHEHAVVMPLSHEQWSEVREALSSNMSINTVQLLRTYLKQSAAVITITEDAADAANRQYFLFVMMQWLCLALEDDDCLSASPASSSAQ